MKRLEGSKRRLDGSLVDVCRVDFMVFCANILVDSICYCMGLVLGWNKVPFVHIMDF